MKLVICGPGPEPGGYPDFRRRNPAAVPARVAGDGSCAAGQPIPLGDTGVAITLTSTGSFHAGDFWRFALRPIGPAIVYPARYLAAPQPPDGPRTWACPLAVLTWDNGSATASSCVPPFPDLVG